MLERSQGPFISTRTSNISSNRKAHLQPHNYRNAVDWHGGWRITLDPTALLLCTRDVPGLILGPRPYYSEDVFVDFIISFIKEAQYFQIRQKSIIHSHTPLQRYAPNLCCS
jgi:hypothetical protein